MSTRRVPGVTRNSGWQAVDAEIAKARALSQPQDGAAAGRVEARADGTAHLTGQDQGIGGDRTPVSPT